MAARKKKSLVIVESPAKAKTINKYLGAGYDVVASKGHVRDLPKSRFGIDIENDWTPTYRVLKDRKELIAALKKQAAAADMVYLAPDPDREGEAIAWHLKESLGLKDDKTRRVTFNEITKTAVQKAFASAGDINMDLVAAQEARRFLDRIVGYRLSPLLEQQARPAPERRPGAVGGGAADRRSRARDPGLQAGGILEDRGAAAAASRSPKAAGAKSRKAEANRRPRPKARADAARTPHDADAGRDGQAGGAAASRRRLLAPSWPSGTGKKFAADSQDADR